MNTKWIITLAVLGMLTWGIFAGTEALMEAGRAPINNQLTEIDE